MAILSLFLVLLGLGSLSTCSNIVKRSWEFSKTNHPCSQEMETVIKEELGNAKLIAEYARDHVTDGRYYDHFFGSSLRNDPTFKGRVGDIFGRIAKMLDPNDNGYHFTITCDSMNDFCKYPDFAASMNDHNKNMNFCPQFKDHVKIRPTTEALTWCNDLRPDCHSIRQFHQSRPSIIIHECTHTRYAMLDSQASDDYAYGYIGSTELAKGTFTRKDKRYPNRRKILCPNPNNPQEDGQCPDSATGRNADSFAHVAAGLFFENKCGKPIPMPDDPMPNGRLRRSNDECDQTDPFFIDRGPDDGFDYGKVDICKRHVKRQIAPNPNALAMRSFILGDDGSAPFEEHE